VNTGEFLKKAGTTIFCLSVVLWALTYYPRLTNDQLLSFVQLGKLGLMKELFVPDQYYPGGHRSFDAGT